MKIPRWLVAVVLVLVALVPTAASSGAIGRITIRISDQIVLTIDDGSVAGARGYATIRTDASPVPPSYGSVGFRGLGSTDDHVTATRHLDASVDITDEGVLIVNSNPYDTSTCSGGLGTAHCTYARFLHLAGAEGNDTITAVGEETSIDGGPGDDRLELRSVSYGFISCGAGYDRAFATTAVSVGTDCEEITLV